MLASNCKNTNIILPSGNPRAKSFDWLHKIPNKPAFPKFVGRTSNNVNSTTDKNTVPLAIRILDKKDQFTFE